MLRMFVRYYVCNIIKSPVNEWIKKFMSVRLSVCCYIHYKFVTQRYPGLDPLNRTICRYVETKARKKKKGSSVKRRQKKAWSHIWKAPLAYFTRDTKSPAVRKILNRLVFMFPGDLNNCSIVPLSVDVEKLSCAIELDQFIAYRTLWLQQVGRIMSRSGPSDFNRFSP